jgi:hypothetical protein
VEAAERVGNPVEVAIRTAALGLFAFTSGDWPRARRLYDQSIEVSRAVGEHTLSPYALFGLGWLSLVEGAWEEARQVLEQGAHIAERTHNLQAQRWRGGSWPSWSCAPDTRLAQWRASCRCSTAPACRNGM